MACRGTHTFFRASCIIHAPLKLLTVQKRELPLREAMGFDCSASLSSRRESSQMCALFYIYSNFSFFSLELLLRN